MTMKKRARSALALLLAVVLCVGMVPTAFAAQEDNYHDPAEHWIEALNRTNELDANSVVTIETFNCCECGQATSFEVFRVPEYTRNGETALTRNVKYSDGTCLDGESKGDLLDGTPGQDAYYTGYHWAKAVCQTCGTFNTNMGATSYACGKNVYWLYDCAADFFEELPEEVTVEQVDSEYHRVITTSGEYCGFCYGTFKEENSTLEHHTMESSIRPELAHDRFVEMDSCADCGYTETAYTAAKAVIADYFGVVDGQPHTVTVSDLSEAGVTTAIRYGHSADACTLTSAPNYTEAGDYPVYYEITYTFKNTDMVEDGVAYVHLRDETTDESGNCTCGCGNPDCGCQDPDCDGCCCEDTGCGENHNWTLLDSVDPTCLTLGYDRYLCVDCGMIEKRDYEAALGHAYQSVVIRDATCKVPGKTIDICERCGSVKETDLPQTEHEFSTTVIPATCTSPGYTLRECTVCGERHIEDITAALPHNYVSKITPATCEGGGRTLHICEGCGSSFITDYTDPLGHSWDEGKEITGATCTGEGMTEYTCIRCGATRLEGDEAAGHIQGDPATCTQPQLCTRCGAVIENALGHDYETVVTEPTCTEMGYTTYTCTRCGDTYKGDYTEAAGHKPGDWIIDKEPTTDSEGCKHKECEVCGETLETEEIEKIYHQATTDSKGEAVVGGYLVIVTDTDTKDPVANATVTLHADDTLSIRLPNSRILDYADQTTVTVLLTKDKSTVEGMFIAVTDKHDNYCEDATNASGQITVPGTTGMTNEDGDTTVGWEDEDGDRWTLTVTVEDYETGRPIEDAEVSIGKGGNITVTLPDGTDMDEDNRITVTVTDNERKPQEGVTVIVKGDLGQSERGETDEDGKLTVPAVTETEYHGAHIYGYTDGTFGPERSMSRSEAAAIFARLLSDKLDERIPSGNNVKFKDIDPEAWYAGYVEYLTGYGVVVGYNDRTYRGDKAITRAEFTTMAARFFDVYGDGAEEIMEQYEGFDDVSDGYWAAEYIKDAAIHGWVEGYGDGTFRADDPIDRAEVVTIVNRLLGREADEDYIADNRRKLVTFPDVSSRHWAYYNVLEAANAHTAVLTDPETWEK
ncbi:S-layer homology domain-containing protein [uncultured Agathobaculum sp.]|uniref:S-layer homology domain-containing protein n=1 Tax=uncultured Agathobaculum sp. TaxID=2048140 RepID=UPI003208EB14